jgi:hypothetical protein
MSQHIYILQVQLANTWTDEYDINADHDEEAEKGAIAYLEEVRPSEGTCYRLLRLCGEVEIAYQPPPPPPEPELEQLSFG